MQVASNNKKAEIELILTKSQNLLFGYIYMLLADQHAAEDVLQETDRTIFKNLDRLDAVENFLPWAKAIARYQVKRYRADVRRESAHLVFDDETVEKLGDSLIAPDGTESERREITFSALEACVKKLPPTKRRMIYLRYWKQVSVQQISEGMALSFSAGKVAFFRIRHELGDCIRRLLCKTGEEPPPSEEETARAELFESVFSQESFDAGKLNGLLCANDGFRHDWLDVSSVHAALLYDIRKLHICGVFTSCERQVSFSRPRAIAAAAGIALLLFAATLLFTFRSRTTTQADKTVNPVTVAAAEGRQAPEPTMMTPVPRSAAKSILPPSPESQAVLAATPVQALPSGHPASAVADRQPLETAMMPPPVRKETHMNAESIKAVALAAAAIALPAAAGTVTTRSAGPHFIDTRDSTTVISGKAFVDSRDSTTGRSAGRRSYTIDTAKPLGTVIMLI